MASPHNAFSQVCHSYVLKPFFTCAKRLNRIAEKKEGESIIYLCHKLVNCIREHSHMTSYLQVGKQVKMQLILQKIGPKKSQCVFHTSDLNLGYQLLSKLNQLKNRRLNIYICFYDFIEKDKFSLLSYFIDTTSTMSLRV